MPIYSINLTTKTHSSAHPYPPIRTNAHTDARALTCRMCWKFYSKEEKWKRKTVSRNLYLEQLQLQRGVVGWQWEIPACAFVVCTTIALTHQCMRTRRVLLCAACCKHFRTSGSQMSYQYLQQSCWLSVCIAVTLVGLPLDMQQSWVVKCKTIIAYLPFDFAASQVWPPKRRWPINTAIIKQEFNQMHIWAAISSRICCFLCDLFALHCCGK